MIVITAPTSRIGAQVVDALLDARAPLRLLVRDPARLPASVRERAEVIEGSHGDAAVIDRACDGADAVFWLTPNLPDAPTLDASFAGFAEPACVAFARHGVLRVVGISALGRGTDLAAHAGAVTASLEMDDAIASSGVAYRAVVNPSFMDNVLNQAGAIAEQGTFFMTIDPDLRAPAVATRDIAATSAELLLDDTWTGTDEVACLGPEDLSPNAMASIMSDVLGREIAYVQIPGAAFKERVKGFGMSDAMAQGLVDMFDAKNRGLDTALRRSAESATPTTFRQWCEEELAPALTA
jgi:uncharacterized protein YbjT (DUF2867 family)